MKLILTDANIVVLASNYNPSIVSKDWILEKGIITENPTNFAHTPGFSHFESENYILTVSENRLLARVRKINDLNVADLPDIVHKYVGSLPETPYTAIGFNYKWIIHPEKQEKNIAGLFKDVFLNQKHKIKFTHAIGNANYTLGGIVYSMYEEFRFKANIEFNEEGLFSFNYHLSLDLTKPRHEQLYNAILKHGKTYEHANNMVKEIMEVVS